MAKEIPLYPPAARAARHTLSAGRYILGLLRNPLRTMPEAVYREPIVPYHALRMPVVWLMGPELIAQMLLEESDRYLRSAIERRVLGPTLGDGLLLASGASWRWQRKIAAPLFRHADILAYVPAMTAAAEAICDSWGRRAGRPAAKSVAQTAGRSAREAPSFSADVGAAMKVATFDVITSTILAGCLPEEAAAIKRADTTLVKRANWELAAGVMGLPPTVWHPAKRSLRLASAQLRQTVLGIVQRRRASAEAGSGGAGPASGNLAPVNHFPADVLARLLAARHPETGEPMTDAMIVDNLATFLEAGHLTTAQALTWTLYLLARAPAWQDRVRAEITAATAGGPLTDPVAQLPVTTRVFKESMRLYPPVPAIVRVASEEGWLGSTRIKSGTTFIISIYATHRHLTLWDDPDRFDPDRFLPEREALMKRGQYLPFGFGQRTCLGMTFAMTEGVAILATLVSRASFDWDGYHLPEPVSRLTLIPRGGMPLHITPA